MTWQVVESDAAARDIEEILAYLAESLHARTAASSFLDRYEEVLSTLETLPLSLPPVRDPALAQAGYRYAQLGRYLLFYSTDSESGTVNVVRVLHGRRNWLSLLGSVEPN